MSETDLSDKERLLNATRKVMIGIMENGREILDGTGACIGYSQPSAADIQAALKLLQREEKTGPADDTNPFAGVDESVKTAIDQTKASHVTGLPPVDLTEGSEWNP